MPVPLSYIFWPDKLREESEQRHELVQLGSHYFAAGFFIDENELNNVSKKVGSVKGIIESGAVNHKKEMVMVIIDSEPIDPLSSELGIEICRSEEWHWKGLRGIKTDL